MGVHLRNKRLKDGRQSLWLDVYDYGQRKAEFLGMVLTGDRQQDKALMKIAEDQRNRRELEILNSVYDFNKSKEGTLLFAYAESYLRQVKSFSQANYWNMLTHLEKCKGRNVRLKDVNTSFVEGFKEYLLSRCKPGTTASYLAKFKRILNLAVDDGLIPKNPARRGWGHSWAQH